MTQAEISTAAHNMITYGGSFYSALGRALLVADMDNQKKILSLWEDEVKQYLRF
jgi:hypothetical protein